jgi:integrase
MPKVLGEPTPRFNMQFAYQEESPVAMAFRYTSRGQRHFLKYSPGLKIARKDWDKKNQFPKRTPANAKMIAKLNKLAEITLQVWRETEGDILPADFRQELNYRFLKHPRPEDRPALTMLEFIDGYIEKQAQRHDRKPPVMLKVWRDNLAAFNQETGRELSFSAIDADWRQSLLDWCFDIRGMSINYVRRGLGFIGQFMAEALEAGLTDNRIAQGKSWKIKGHPTTTIALNEDELQAIADVDLSALPDSYEKARQLFLIGAYTGLRHSDYKRIQRGHVAEDQGRKHIAILTQKTSKPVRIPLHPNLERILERTGYQAPKLSRPKLNECIKEVCRMAGITEMRAAYGSAGGKLAEEFKPKYELVSSHTGRRSFATNALINGWPSPLIRAITGHSSEAQLYNYVDYAAYLAAAQVSQFYKSADERSMKAI